MGGMELGRPGGAVLLLLNPILIHFLRTAGAHRSIQAPQPEMNFRFLLPQWKTAT